MNIFDNYLNYNKSVSGNIFSWLQGANVCAGLGGNPWLPLISGGVTIHTPALPQTSCLAHRSDHGSQVNMSVKRNDCNLHPLWESHIYKEDKPNPWDGAQPFPCCEVLMSTQQGSMCPSAFGTQNQVLMCYTFTGLNDSYRCRGLDFSG